MPSAKVGFPSTPSVGGTGPIAGPGSRRGLLVETLQIVEPKKYQPVPNHLLESKIYSKVERNSVVQARPDAIHFKGFELGKKFTEILEIDNISDEVIRMHIIPPQTKYFYVKYNKGDRLVPGMSIKCTVEFYPDEWRYYYDCIRVHTPGEENLIIPIHAYPLLNTSDWPQLLDFCNVPVGQMASRIIPLRCQAPIDFEFEVAILQHHPAFTVDPRAGIVPAHGEVDIVVTFRPTEFSTAQMKIQLTYSQFNAQPLVCTIMGGSKPGLAKDILKAEFEAEEPLDPRSITPSGRAKQLRLKKQSSTSIDESASSSMHVSDAMEVMYQDIKFPVNLDNPHAVAQVLNQEPGKIRLKDLKDAISQQANKGKEKTRQMKVAMFEKEVRENVNEERQNQLRWQTRLGDDQIDQTEREQVLSDRVFAQKEYSKKRGDPVESKELRRKKTEAVYRRTRRSCEKLAPEVAQFDLYSNNGWPLRMDALGRFQQAARTVMLRNRINHRLVGIRKLVKEKNKDKLLLQEKVERCKESPEKKFKLESDWKKEVNKSYYETRKFLQSDPDVWPESEAVFGGKKKDVDDSYRPRVDIAKLQTEKFGKGVSFTDHEMAIDLSGPVPYYPTRLEMSEEILTHRLQPPIEFLYRGLTYFKVYQLAQVYEPLGLARPLRTGAEEEVAKVMKRRREPKVTREESVEDLNIAVVAVDISQQHDQTQAEIEPEFDPISPPKTIFQPIEYPPLHVFNPAPGVQTFEPALPYSEIDMDFHLNPLPQFVGYDFANPHMSSQKPFLDKTEIVPGLMTWQRFPSQSLVSLSHTPTLTNVWVPRWSDPFDSSVMPQQVPALQDHLAASDEENIDEDEDDPGRAQMLSDSLTLTPEMVASEFPDLRKEVGTANKLKRNEDEPSDMFPYGSRMPPTNMPVGQMGPVPREKREIELNFFLTRKSNRLGNKLNDSIKRLNNLKNNPDLMLKWDKES